MRGRWGKAAHLTFLFFALLANVIVTSMLLLGGAATVNALTGVDTNLASFLIPWGVILHLVLQARLLILIAAGLGDETSRLFVQLQQGLQ